ncbi:MAG: histidine triad nucleotide-binding protein [Clostridia bacterium]|nr:histidine triad nucleotide-binding protein [Clostridia bacterium]
MDCIFCKIIKGEIPSARVYEDEDMIVIRDIAPQAKYHYLAIPKKHFADVTEMTEEDAVLVGRMLRKIGDIAASLGLEGGFRLVSNKGADAMQSVPHLHIHILGGEKLSDKMC